MNLVKNNLEIEYIRKSNKIIAELFELLKRYVKEGISKRELDKIAEDFILSKGAFPSFKGYRPALNYPPYPAATCISVNEEVIHGIPNDYKLKNGDIVSIDVGTLYNGYYGDATFTYEIGQVSKEVHDLSEHTRKSLMLAIEVAKEGHYVNEIGYVVSSYITPRGYGIVREYCGHGVGKAIHEDPPILNYYDPKRKGPKFKAGMVIAIEPMITLGNHQIEILSNGWTVVTKDRKPAAHWEHSVLITDGAPEILSVI